MSNIGNFIPPGPLKTPVLFLVFNRPYVTEKVFESIRRVQPARFYVAADGPRLNIPGEVEKCKRVRGIASAVDWDCDMHTLFRDKNLGCRVAVSSAINWFFEHESEGIILEDDCLPSLSFYWFCEELLDRYRDDSRIMQICGSNFSHSRNRNQCSYYFSKYGPIWGWASWRRAWEYYDVEMKLWPEVKKKKILNNFCDSKKERKYRENIYDRVFSGLINTWDYQWGFAKLINSGLSIIPVINMISNIGFAGDGTHIINDNSPFASMKALDVDFPLQHPQMICRNRLADQEFINNFVLSSPLRNMEQKIASIFKKFVRIL